MSFGELLKNYCAQNAFPVDDIQCLSDIANSAEFYAEEHQIGPKPKKRKVQSKKVVSQDKLGETVQHT